MSPADPTTPTVFISYRRSQTAGHAGRLYDAMASRFGDANVFMDVDMQPGVDFVQRITTVLAACHVLLVVMGPDWARPEAGQTQPRIADPDDFVGLEVATGLRRSDVTVIPLLVAGACMPDPDELPEQLRALTRRNALELSDLRWRYDVGRLLVLLEQLLADQQLPPDAAPAAEHAVAVDGAPDRSPAAAAKPFGWMAGRARIAAGAAAVVAAGLLAAVVVAAGAPSESPNAPVPTAPTVSASSQEDAARPERVPPDCEDKGLTQWAKDVEARREWHCPIESPDVTGPSLTYLEFGDPTAAHESFKGSRSWELGHGWRPCPNAPPSKLNSAGDGRAWCLQSTAEATVEISWHREGSNLVGVLTCDPPTTVAAALKAWRSLV